MPNILQVVKDSLKSLETVLVGKLTGLKQSISTLQTSSENQGTSITALQQRATAIEQKDTAQDQTLTSHGSRLTTLEAKDSGERLVLAQEITVTAGNSQGYDIEALLGANAAQYAIGSATIVVRVKNTGAGFPDGDEWINAEASCVYGLKANKKVVFVYNTSAEDIDVFIKITVPKI